MNNLQAYIERAEVIGAKNVVVPIEALRVLLEVADSARAFVDCYIVETPDCADHETTALLSALARLDKARRG